MRIVKLGIMFLFLFASGYHNSIAKALDTVTDRIVYIDAEHIELRWWSIEGGHSRIIHIDELMQLTKYRHIKKDFYKLSNTAPDTEEADVR